MKYYHLVWRKSIVGMAIFANSLKNNGNKMIGRQTVIAGGIQCADNTGMREQMGIGGQATVILFCQRGDRNNERAAPFPC
jgi:hypothetical protein